MPMPDRPPPIVWPGPYWPPIMPPMSVRVTSTTAPASLGAAQPVPPRAGPSNAPLATASPTVDPAASTIAVSVPATSSRMLGQRTRLTGPPAGAGGAWCTRPRRSRRGRTVRPTAPRRFPARCQGQARRSGGGRSDSAPGRRFQRSPSPRRPPSSRSSLARPPSPSRSPTSSPSPVRVVAHRPMAVRAVQPAIFECGSRLPRCQGPLTQASQDRQPPPRRQLHVTRRGPLPDLPPPPTPRPAGCCRSQGTTTPPRPRVDRAVTAASLFGPPGQSPRSPSTSNTARGPCYPCFRRSPATMGGQMTTPGVSAGGGATGPICRNHRPAPRCAFLLVKVLTDGRTPRHARRMYNATTTATTTTKVVRHLLDQAGITPSPRRVTAAHTRRATTDQQLTTRAAELGFPPLQDYLTDRGMIRRWPTTSIASQLGVHPATVGDRLDQHRLPRRRATIRPRRAIARQRALWAAKRQARLAELGFADLEGYLRVRRVGQGWSLRRMLAELQVGPAWLKDQMHQLGIP